MAINDLNLASKKDIASLKSDTNALKSDVTTIKVDMAIMKRDIVDLRAELGGKLDRVLNQLDALVKKMTGYEDEQEIDRSRIEALENIHPNGRHQAI